MNKDITSELKTGIMYINKKSRNRNNVESKFIYTAAFIQSSTKHLSNKVQNTKILSRNLPVVHRMLWNLFPESSLVCAESLINISRSGQDALWWDILTGGTESPVMKKKENIPHEVPIFIHSVSTELCSGVRKASLAQAACMCSCKCR